MVKYHMELADCTDQNTKLMNMTGSFDCKVVDVHDGDTFKAVVPLNGSFVKIVCRVQGIDTREIKPPLNLEGRAEYVRMAHKARNRLVQLLTNIDLDLDTMYKETRMASMMLTNSKIVTLLVFNQDKYGRMLVDLPGLGVQQTLISEGHALAYDGGAKTRFVQNAPL